MNTQNECTAELQWRYPMTGVRVRHRIITKRSVNPGAFDAKSNSQIDRRPSWISESAIAAFLVAGNGNECR